MKYSSSRAHQVLVTFRETTQCWEFQSTIRMDNEKAEAPALRVTTWNMLNPQFETEKYYPASVHKFLHWREGRKERALAYLKPLHSDIYCIQETNEEIANQLTNTLGTEYELLYNNVSLSIDLDLEECAFQFH